MIPDGILDWKHQANHAFAEEHARRIENGGRTEVNQGEITTPAKEKYSRGRESDRQQDKSYGHSCEFPTQFRGRQRRNVEDEADKGRHCRRLYVVRRGKANAALQPMALSDRSELRPR